MLTSCPLCWPDGWTRTRSDWKNGKFTRFNKWVSVSDSVGRILESLGKMGIKRDDVIISTNIPTRLDGLPRSDQSEPADKGAAVYWRKSRNAPMKCMAIDRYTTVADNLAAIAATLEAMRAIERHGGAEILERTFTGFAALPASTGRAWWEVLGTTENASREHIEEQYRHIARQVHPDVSGGSHDAMVELNRAMKEALKEVTH